MSALNRQVLSKGLPPKIGTSKRLPPNRDLSPLEWSEFFDEKKCVRVGEDSFNVYLKGSAGPIFLVLHGGGYTGLTWACFAEDLSRRIDCRIIAPDLRGHGETQTADDANLSAQQQINDIEEIVKQTIAQNENSPVCLIGHSMGGALAVRVAERGNVPNLVGLVVIDVVEGSAMEALSGMITFLRSRPTTFPTTEKAIVWCLQSGTAKNYRAARVSMPSQIRHSQEGSGMTWRIDLIQTQPHWRGWFEGLSSLFLSVSAPKLLVLAGVDRLDKDLTVGQMQGKFQTCVVPQVGHCVQEDSPDRLADEVAKFAIRHKFAAHKPGWTDPIIGVPPCC
ncbi:hypothetical protein WR25_20980 [Diploscapter pachys]|uniref:Protein phosphatase methylesterase 1 n=1 Tax=Diploscapter pachys TaxID=2018661 RepID=A0A2A2K4A2_9BILA|nr:hypothetical protein WR25_20980 [Diploscapter pachys]